MFKAGLFTAVGAVTVVESYKWLLPDPSDKIVDLLTQLVNVTQKIPLTSGNEEPFKRTFNIVAANALLFTSMVDCVVCAFLATLVQQWAEQYLALADARCTPDERVHVQIFLLREFRRPWISIVRMGLHVALILYSVGILLFFYHIDQHFAVLVLVEISLALFAYAAATILPVFLLDLPICTPFSAPLWCIWNSWLAVMFSGIANLFSCLLSDSYVETLQTRAQKHRQRCADGLGKTIEFCAKKYVPPNDRRH